MANELASPPPTRGATQVNVTHDHDGVTLDIGHAGWLRGVVLLTALVSIAPSVLFIAAFGTAILRSPILALAILPPLVIGVALTGTIVRRRLMPSASVIGMAALPAVFAGVWDLGLAWLSISPWTGALLLLGGGQLVAAAWMIYNAASIPRDRQIRLTPAHLKVEGEGGEVCLALKDIEGANVRYRRLILQMRGGSYETLGRELPISTLEWLARQVADAAVRRRQSMTEERLPPEELNQLVDAAKNQPAIPQ